MRTSRSRRSGVSDASARLVSRRLTASVLCLLAHAGAAAAQPLSQRGFVEGSAWGFLEPTPQDGTQLIGDLLIREDLFVTIRPWLRVTAGADLRANSHDQVTGDFSFLDRTARRAVVSVRSLKATISRGHLTLDAGKQFVRWGKTDIVVPTDRFAPRDFLNLVDPSFLAVVGLRATMDIGSYTVEGVWVPVFTPSRIPLVDQRWVRRPAQLPADVTFVETAPLFPGRSQVGARVGHVAGRVDYSVSFYDGFNNLPDIQVSPDRPQTIGFQRVYPHIRTFGADVSAPLPGLLLKTEAAYFTSSSPFTDEYVLYVVQVERQQGEWVFVAGYAGEVVTRLRSLLTFDPDRGLSRSIVTRASYSFDARRSIEAQTAVRQNGEGIYVKAEYSQASGSHWRTTVAAVVLAGAADDFIGQYRDNSHVRFTVRYSF
jgi:hypothetical protein